MISEIAVVKFQTIETAADGTAVRLTIEDHNGQTVGIVLPIEMLTSLIMTLPTAASNAVKRFYNDPSMRITYPLTSFEIELSSDDIRILTMGTDGGFSVCFSLSAELSAELGRAHLEGRGGRARTH